jgi:Tfp pilus assembly protein PilN
MKLPTLPTGWPRIAVYVLGILLLAAGITYAVPQVKSAVANYLLADREAELREQIEGKLQPQIDEANKEREAAQEEAEQYRKLAADRAKTVAKLTKERAALQTQVTQSGAAIQATREEAAHVADAELLPRIRASLARLRAGLGG